MIMKKEKGITLLVLIITIVVLLILATVSVRNINEGGIIDKAKNTTNTYNEKSAEYDLKMAITQCYSLYGNLTELESVLDNSIWEYQILEGFGKATAKEGQYQFTIDLSSGNITREK